MLNHPCQFEGCFGCEACSASINAVANPLSAAQPRPIDIGIAASMVCLATDPPPHVLPVKHYHCGATRNGCQSDGALFRNGVSYCHCRCAPCLAAKRAVRTGRSLTLADLTFTSHDDKRQPNGTRTIIVATYGGATFAASYCTNRRKAEHAILQAFIAAGHTA